ncbi:MAG: DUF2442 domain-containing protein [Sideroxydans sp.]|jgi:Protein of unknown function (DUF2442)|nr:DUF2442 domain-containing protein [Sideroxydans sp.]
MNPINITRAEQLSDYALRLSFEDGVVQTVDFKPFLSLSRHPDIRAFLDPARFAAYRIEYGELVWGDYDLCFPIADLYHNHLLPNAALQKAA